MNKAFNISITCWIVLSSHIGFCAQKPTSSTQPAGAIIQKAPIASASTTSPAGNIAKVTSAALTGTPPQTQPNIIIKPAVVSAPATPPTPTITTKADEMLAKSRADKIEGMSSGGGISFSVPAATPSSTQTDSLTLDLNEATVPTATLTTAQPIPLQKAPPVTQPSSQTSSKTADQKSSQAAPSAPVSDTYFSGSSLLSDFASTDEIPEEDFSSLGAEESYEDVVIDTGDGSSYGDEDIEFEYEYVYE